MGFKKNTIERTLFNYTDVGNVQEFNFKDNKPTVLQIQNRGSATIYVGDERNLDANNFDVQVVTKGKIVWTVPAGIQKFYVYSTATAEFKVISAESDEIFSSDLDRTQETVITNSTTTSSVTINDGSHATFGAKTDALSTDETAINKSFMSYVKGFMQQIKSVVSLITARLPSALTGGGGVKTGLVDSLPAGTNNIGDVDIASSLPSGTNTIGKVQIVDPTGAEMDLYGDGDNYSATDHANAILMLVEGSPDKYRFLRGNSNFNLMVSQEEDNSKPSTVVVYNVALTLADTEYSQALPSNCKKFSVSIQDGASGDNYRLAFETGKVGTPTAPFVQLPQSAGYSEDNVDLASGTIYLASSVAGATAQIIAWN